MQDLYDEMYIDSGLLEKRDERLFGEKINNHYTPERLGLEVIEMRDGILLTLDEDGDYELWKWCQKEVHNPLILTILFEGNFYRWYKSVSEEDLF